MAILDSLYHFYGFYSIHLVKLLLIVLCFLWFAIIMLLCEAALIASWLSANSTLIPAVSRFKLVQFHFFFLQESWTQTIIASARKLKKACQI